MAIDKLVAPLLRVPAFVGLRPLQITEIARQAERHAFQSGRPITEAGAAADGAYLLVSGPAECVTEAAIRSAPEPVVPGTMIGELAMLAEHHYGATVVARGRVLCLKITRVAMHAQMLEDVALARHLQHYIAERLRRADDELRQIDRTLAACGIGTPHALAHREAGRDVVGLT